MKGVKMKNLLLVFGLFAILLSSIVTGCKETDKDFQNEIVPLPTLTKENMENQAWQMELCTKN
jgi:hypothetical protein